ncbi:MAG: hypothetical protein Q7S14_03290 [bacterium]|nr:hypothetical protein [bacterium]
MKYYCFVDETGQDTMGKMFIVSVVVPETREELESYVLKAEVESGKGKLKWGRADKNKRLVYLEKIITQRKFPLKIYFSSYENTKEYKSSTILTIAKAISTVKNNKDSEFTVLVDGLNEKDQRYYGSQLRRLNFTIRKIRGVRKDENDVLIRLADSICGFIRDYKESNDLKIKCLFEKMVDGKVLVEV